MVGRNRFAVKVGGKQEVLLQNNFQWQVDRESVFSMLHHMRSARLDLEQALLHHCFDGDTFPQSVKFAPARHAVNIHLDFGARQFVELIPYPALFLLHFTPDTKVPSGRVKVWNRTIMENRKFESERLPGWEAAFFTNTVFFLASIRSLK